MFLGEVKTFFLDYFILNIWPVCVRHKTALQFSDFAD